MNGTPSVATLAEEVTRIYRADAPQADDAIERYLLQRLDALTPHERIGVVDALAEHFGPAEAKGDSVLSGERDRLSQVVSRILGKKISPDMSCSELMEKLAHSLNTIFTTLNRVIGVIHVTLLGDRRELQTIRQMIGSDMEGLGESDSLESYIDQIQDAFLITHDAFKSAVRTKVQDMLRELDPERIAASTEAGLKFGPLRKAEFFAHYEDIYRRFAEYVNSGRFIEEVLREFERTSQKLYRSHK